MSLEHPGIGFRNHTVPVTDHGGIWSEDILWLEPLTSCIDTNITIHNIYKEIFEEEIHSGDFRQTAVHSQSLINVTYHGDTPIEKPPSPAWPFGRDFDLGDCAYTTAVMSNNYVWNEFTRDALEDPSGNVRIVNWNKTCLKAEDYIPSSGYAQKTFLLPVYYSTVNYDSNPPPPYPCNQYTACNISENPLQLVGKRCGIIARMTGLNRNDELKYSLTACSSITRASIQHVTFSTNHSQSSLEITRSPVNYSTLWAIQKSELIDDSDLYNDLYWGRIADQYDNSPLFWTERSDGFYLPPTTRPWCTSIGGDLPPDQALSSASYIWDMIYKSTKIPNEYWGGQHWALENKIQDLLNQNPVSGHAQIFNLIWTDMMANNIMGTLTSDTLLVERLRTSLQYDIRYAIPGFILFAIWAPSFLISSLLLISRTLTFQYMRKVLDHTSVGRVIVGSSALRPEEMDKEEDEEHEQLNSDDQGTDSYSGNLDSTETLNDSSNDEENWVGQRKKKRKWRKDRGKMRVVLDLPAAQSRNHSKAENVHGES